MFANLKKRLSIIEDRMNCRRPFWPGDSDLFLEALGISGAEKEKYRRVNPGGDYGFDAIAVLAATAAKVWKGGDNQ